jgi:hypothetical protein
MIGAMIVAPAFFGYQNMNFIFWILYSRTTIGVNSLIVKPKT